MNSLSKLVTWSYAIPHELCHYAVARLLGMPARFHLMHVHLIPDSDTDWRLLPVILAPSMAGIVVWSLMVWRGFVVDKPGAAVLIGLAFNLIWQLTCLADWERLVFFVRHDRWPRDNEISQEQNPYRRLAHFFQRQ